MLDQRRITPLHIGSPVGLKHEKNLNAINSNKICPESRVTKLSSFFLFTFVCSSICFEHVCLSGKIAKCHGPIGLDHVQLFHFIDIVFGVNQLNHKKFSLSTYCSHILRRRNTLIFAAMNTLGSHEKVVKVQS